MRRALIFITLKEWQSHKLRTIITLFSVAIGVSTYFAIRTANQSLQESFEDTVDRLAGKATLQVTRGGTGFPEEVLGAVRATPGVIDATAVVEAVYPIDSMQAESGSDQPLSTHQAHPSTRDNPDDRVWLLILGVDLRGEQKLRGGEGYGSALLRLPGTVVISSAFADEQHLKPRHQITILTPQGKSPLRVLSVFKSEGIGELYGGHVGVMDIHSAQAALGRGRTIDRIDLITAPGIEIESVRQSLKDRLAPGLEVERPRSRSQEVEDSTLLIRRGFILTSLVAILVSSFLIFNAMSISVNQRWKQIGVMRALGVPQRSLQVSFLVEAGLIGLIGSVLGVLAGYCLAVQLSGLKLTGHIANVVSSNLVVLAVPIPPRFNVGFALQSIAIGVGFAAISAWLPARAAGRLKPALALHNIETRQSELVVGNTRIILGAALILAGLFSIRFTTPLVGTMFDLIYVALIFVGFVVILPGVSCRASSALRPLADRLFGSTGVLALDSIIHSPRRTSATVGAIMAGLAFVFSNWATLKSEKQTVVNSFAQQINFDLQVQSPAPLTDDVAARLALVPGIELVDPNSSVTAHCRNQIAGVRGSDMALWFERSSNTMTAGDFDQARILVPKGEAILVSENFAGRWNLRLGEILTLDTPTGKLERPVVGFVNANFWFEGTVFLDRTLIQQYWPDARISWLNIDLSPEADARVVRTEIERVVMRNQAVAVFTADEIRNRGRDAITRNIDQVFSFFYVQMFIATFVAVAGIVNTLVISVWDRRREIGIIRAVGGKRGQVARMILLEAAALVLIGLVIGTTKGLVDTYFMTHTAARVFAGYTLPFYLPFGLILLSAPILAIVALGSAVWPARLAARTNVIDAIGSE